MASFSHFSSSLFSWILINLPLARFKFIWMNIRPWKVTSRCKALGADSRLQKVQSSGHNEWLRWCAPINEAPIGHALPPPTKHPRVHFRHLLWPAKELKADKYESFFASCRFEWNHKGFPFLTSLSRMNALN